MSILTSLTAEELREKADTMQAIARSITKHEEEGTPHIWHRPASFYQAIADDCRAAAAGLDATPDPDDFHNDPGAIVGPPGPTALFYVGRDYIAFAAQLTTADIADVDRLAAHVLAAL